MVVCLNNKDRKQPGRWLTSSLQANSRVNKADTVVHQLSPQLNMPTSRWATEVLPVPVAMAVVLSKLQTLNGVLQRLRASAMALEATRDNRRIHFMARLIVLSGGGSRDINSGGFFTSFLHDFSYWVSPLGYAVQRFA
jgi:hypothetical protein